MKQQKHIPRSHSSTESGYTILEGIVAIIVVAILMTAVTPMIVWSVATRLQAKRVQLSASAARSYMTFLRSNPSANAPGNVGDGDNVPPEAGQLSDGNAANGESRCTTEEDGYCAGKQLYCVSFDENPGCQTDSLTDMVVQPMVVGDFPTDASGQFAPGKPYEVAVRVYRANAFSGDFGDLKADEVDRTSATSSTSEDGNVGIALLGNPILPLIQLRTSVSSRSTRDDEKYDEFCQALPDLYKTDCEP